jgi:hypothetical protein
MVGLIDPAMVMSFSSDVEHEEENRSKSTNSSAKKSTSSLLFPPTEGSGTDSEPTTPSLKGVGLFAASCARGAAVDALQAMLRKGSNSNGLQATNTSE